MNDSQPSIAETLREMAKLTVLSGRVSELQIHNLKMFPLVYFNHIQEVSVEYDLSHKSDVLDDYESNKIVIKAPTRNALVSYHLMLDDSKNTNLDSRFMALEKSVRSLFWDDVIIEVYFNKKIAYKSSK